jgi:hypothetical protein
LFMRALSGSRVTVYRRRYRLPKTA